MHLDNCCQWRIKCNVILMTFFSLFHFQVRTSLYKISELPFVLNIHKKLYYCYKEILKNNPNKNANNLTLSFSSSLWDAKVPFFTLSTPSHRAIPGTPRHCLILAVQQNPQQARTFSRPRMFFSFLSALNFRVILCHKTFTRVNGGNVFQVIPGPRVYFLIFCRSSSSSEFFLGIFLPSPLIWWLHFLTTTTTKIGSSNSRAYSPDRNFLEHTS